MLSLLNRTCTHDLLAYHVFINIVWNNCNVYNGRTGIDHLCYLLIFHSHNMHCINFQYLMVSQQSIASSGRVLYQTNNFAIFKLKAEMIVWILVKSNSSLKRPKTNKKTNTIIIWELYWWLITENVYLSNYHALWLIDKKVACRLNYLSRTDITIPLTGAFFNILWHLSIDNPATATLLISNTWSPNLNPARAAGLPAAT